MGRDGESGRAAPGGADAVSRSVQIIRHATSLGGVELTIERRAVIPGQTHVPLGLLRLSVGCEQPDDLWRDGGVLRPLVHRGGLRADVVCDGSVRVGDRLTAI